ncbi:MAG: acyl-CoA dehydrogenase, partial [Planctomycetaceae bacterium]|nr:acyl-CoA dehydrogenase [Planctomycetaceae bacterium]
MSPHADHLEPQDSSAIPAVSFAETALRLGGKSADEARRTGAVDTADDQVEAMFAERYRTSGSPVHRAVWQNRVPTELFESHPITITEENRRVMRDSLAVIRRHRSEGTLLDAQSKISDQVLRELAEAGYWGALI